MSEYEISQQYFKALAPSITAALLAMYLFDIEQCEEEDPRLCIKLADKDYRVTGSTKIPTANAEFYGDGWAPNKLQKKVPGTENKWETVAGFQDWAMGTLLSGLGNLSDKLRLDPDRLDKKDIADSAGAMTTGAIDYFMNFGFESALKLPAELLNMLTPSYDGSTKQVSTATGALGDRLIRPLIPGAGLQSFFGQAPNAVQGGFLGDWRSGMVTKAPFGTGWAAKAVDKVLAKTWWAGAYDVDYDVLGYPVHVKPRTALGEITRAAVVGDTETPKEWQVLAKFPELEGAITYYNPVEKTDEIKGDKNYEILYKGIPQGTLFEMRKEAAGLKRQMIAKGYNEMIKVPTPQELRAILEDINKLSNEHSYVANIIENTPELKKLDQSQFKTRKKAEYAQIFPDQSLYDKEKLTKYLVKQGKIVDNGKLRKSDVLTSKEFKTSEATKKELKRGND